MKEVILKRERIFHFLALGLVAVSLFIRVPEQKLGLLMAGILGLLILSLLKKQKLLIGIYAVLIVAAVVFYYLMTSGKINSF
ncbi:hypothetical protein [Kaistella palustris]|uniref:hypothetical protein n=1 Tax=Kaistella palustris TaxID=493376 RepID=UPI00040EAEDC|nr:hypothetical protein [Kaistella palustris]